MKKLFATLIPLLALSTQAADYLTQDGYIRPYRHFSTPYPLSELGIRQALSSSGWHFHGLARVYVEFNPCENYQPLEDFLPMKLLSVAQLGCTADLQEVEQKTSELDLSNPNDRKLKKELKRLGVDYQQVVNAREVCTQARTAYAAQEPKITAQRAERAKQFGSCQEKYLTIHREINLIRASSDGMGWTLENSIRVPMFSHFVVGGGSELKVRANIRLQSCDNQPIVRQLDEKAPLDEVIASFQEFNPKEFWSCDFSVDGQTAIVREAVVPEYRSLFEVETITGAGQVKLLASGQLIISSGDESNAQIAYVPGANAIDPNARAAALEAVRRFVALIKEHGRVIISASTAGAGEGEIRNLANASIQARKPEILKQLATLNANYAQLATIDKLSASVSVAKAYGMVQQIETRVGRLVDERDRLSLNDLVNSGR